MNVPMLPFVVGLGVAAGALTWVGWWLDSQTGVVTMLALLFIAALAVPRSWREATALWAGAMTAAFVGLLWTGPGTLWPIALVLSGAMMAGAVLIAMALRRLVALAVK